MKVNAHRELNEISDNISHECSRLAALMSRYEVQELDGERNLFLLEMARGLLVAGVSGVRSALYGSASA